MPAKKDKKKRLRALLAKAQVEIGAKPAPIEGVAPNTLVETAREEDSSQKFFNTNDSCSAPQPVMSGVHMPEFNTNGSCLSEASAADVEKGLALVNALRNALR